MKKLNFRKSTISKLDSNELEYMKAGNVPTCLGRPCKNSEWLICIKDSLFKLKETKTTH